MALTKEQIGEFGTTEVKVSTVPVVDTNSDVYKFEDFDGFGTFMTDTLALITGLETSVSTLTGEKAVLVASLATSTGDLVERDLLITDLMQDRGPLRDLRKYSDLSRVNKWDYVTNKNTLGFDQENYKIFLFQWVIDATGEANSLVPGPLVCTLFADADNDTLAERGIAAAITLLEASEVVLPGTLLNRVTVEGSRNKSKSSYIEK